MTHNHRFDIHPNQKFEDMCYCTICRWGTTKASLVRSMMGCSYPKIKSEQLSDELALDLFYESEEELAYYAELEAREEYLSRYDRLQGMADRGCDTWEEYRCER
jgi:hypothetical protein